MKIIIQENIINFKSENNLKEFQLLCLKSVIKYIKNKVKNIESTIKDNINNKNFEKDLNLDYIDKYIASGSYEDFESLLTLSKLKNLCINLLQLEKQDKKDFTNNIIFQDCYNPLIEYNLLGLYWLLNISCENTFFSPGQSLDLWKLLKLVDTYWENTSLKFSKKFLIDLFFNSFDKYTPIQILFN